MAFRAVCLLFFLWVCTCQGSEAVGKTGVVLGPKGNLQGTPQEQKDSAGTKKLLEQEKVVNVLTRNPVGPHDRAGYAPPPMAPHIHQATLKKMGAADPGLVCSPALFEVNEVAHPSPKAVFSLGSMSAGEVLSHVTSQLGGMNFASLPLAPFHNVDGRTSHPILSTMGADAGELLLALNAFESFMPMPFSEAQVKLFIEDYLLNTDLPVLQLQVDEKVLSSACEKGCCPPSCRLDSVPPESQAELLDLVSSVDGQGSAHFRHLLQHPEAFRTRIELTQYFVRSLFRILWGSFESKGGHSAQKIVQNKLRLVVLSGSHREQALLLLQTSSCNPLRTPLIVPEISGSSLFVIHEDAAQHRRMFNADWLVEMGEKMNIGAGGRDGDRLVSSMRCIASDQYRAALELDGGRTPIFSLSFPSACCA